MKLLIVFCFILALALAQGEDKKKKSRPPLTCANVRCAEGPCIETPTGPKCTTMSTTERPNENECGENEHWVGPCASRCEGTCDKPVPTICTKECFQGCKSCISNGINEVEVLSSQSPSTNHVKQLLPHQSHPHRELFPRIASWKLTAEDQRHLFGPACLSAVFRTSFWQDHAEWLHLVEVTNWIQLCAIREAFDLAEQAPNPLGLVVERPIHPSGSPQFASNKSAKYFQLTIFSMSRDLSGYRNPHWEVPLEHDRRYMAARYLRRKFPEIGATFRAKLRKINTRVAVNSTIIDHAVDEAHDVSNELFSALQRAHKMLRPTTESQNSVSNYDNPEYLAQLERLRFAVPTCNHRSGQSEQSEQWQFAKHHFVKTDEVRPFDGESEKLRKEVYDEIAQANFTSDDLVQLYGPESSRNCEVTTYKHLREQDFLLEVARSVCLQEVREAFGFRPQLANPYALVAEELTKPTTQLHPNALKYFQLQVLRLTPIALDPQYSWDDQRIRAAQYLLTRFPVIGRLFASRWHEIDRLPLSLCPSNIDKAFDATLKLLGHLYQALIKAYVKSQGDGYPGSHFNHEHVAIWFLQLKNDGA
ncbi:unnamed protein product, partial [Mesorhabditis belari]|uniref:Uncharacterized protein n=1 Tax=Mesorhabditis belari TaxID=2138241 RepID=A0AAF3EBZ8_9BILA